MERETGIEPASLAWKAKVLPLNYSRVGVFNDQKHSALQLVRPGRPLRCQLSHICSSHSPGFSFLCEKPGGGGWIRTNVGVSQQIYSLPPLATRPPLRRPSDYST